MSNRFVIVRTELVKLTFGFASTRTNRRTAILIQYLVVNCQYLYLVAAPVDQQVEGI